MKILRSLQGCVAGLLMVAATLAWADSLPVKVVDKAGKPLADAVVFLESPAARAATKAHQSAAIAQVNKQFVPQVTVVPLGSSVQFPNQDTVRHHVYSFSPAKTFELKLYTGTPANPVLFDKPGVVTLGCNIHDTMTAWVLVVETPYFGKTAADGGVSLEAPAGAYRLRVWHPGLPPGAPAADQPVTLPAPASLRVTLTGVSA